MLLALLLLQAASTRVLAICRLRLDLQDTSSVRINGISHLIQAAAPPGTRGLAAGVVPVSGAPQFSLKGQMYLLIADGDCPAAPEAWAQVWAQPNVTLSTDLSKWGIWNSVELTPPMVPLQTAGEEADCTGRSKLASIGWSIHTLKPHAARAGLWFAPCCATRIRAASHSIPSQGNPTS